jgi:hypothetical protein
MAYHDFYIQLVPSIGFHPRQFCQAIHNLMGIDRCQKVKMARRLRQETTMTLHWIAQRLNIGVAGSLANLLRDAERKSYYAIMRD